MQAAHHRCDHQPHHDNQRDDQHDTHKRISLFDSAAT
jgi:hypothetical protein